MSENAEVLESMIEARKAELAGESHHRNWLSAISCFSKIEKAITAKNPDGLRSAMGQMSRILSNGQGKEKAERDLRQLIQEHARLVKKGAPKALDGQMDVALARVIAAIEEEVADPHARERIAERIRRSVSPEAGPET